MAEQRYVVVGAGLAGAKAVEAIREAGGEGPVTLVGEEPDRPYERPPLSKDLLLGKKDREVAFVHPAEWYAGRDVDLRTGTRATGLDRDTRVVELADGKRVRYDRLLLATGSSPRRLDVPGADLDGIAYLRRLDQAESLRDMLRRGGSVVVVGGGWIGLEVAAAARHHGAEVTIVEPQPTPLHGVLGSEVGEAFARLHRDHGVEVRTGEGVERIEGSGGRVTGVRTSSGAVLPADLVVVGVGVRPNTELAEAAGLAVDNGVLVDEQLRTSDPAIFAAGDVANAAHPLLGARLRVEHWANASNQGAAAGRSMVGAGEPYAKLPYFYTDQYALSMEYHGHASGRDQVVLRGRPLDGPEEGGWFAFWLRGGQVHAGMNVNDWEAAGEIKRLVRERATVAPARLADPAVPLGEL